MRYLLILICVVFGGGEFCAQPAVAFETKTYDLGEVGEKGGAVSRISVSKIPGTLRW